MPRKEKSLGRMRAADWEGLDARVENGRVVATATCADGCGETMTRGFPISAAPEMVTKAFKQAGWRLRHGVTHCPKNCKRKETDMSASIKPPVISSAVPSVSEIADCLNRAKDFSANGAAPTPAAAAVRRMVYMALEDAYDEGRGYKEGFSDDRIAKENSCAAQLVAKVREEFFGPAAPPEPESIVILRRRISEAEKDVQAAKRIAADAERVLTILRTDFDKLVAAQGWRQ